MGDPIFPCEPKEWVYVVFCIDYPILNAVSRRDTYLIPRMEGCIDPLGHAQNFRTLDVNYVLWKIPIDENAKSLPTFTTHEGILRLLRMPLGLMNAPDTSQ